MTETERADRLRAIAELAEEIQSGKRAVVSDEQLASDIYARKPSLRAGSPWAVWVRLVQRATTNYGNRRSTGWMPPPVSESKRAIVAEAIRGGAQTNRGRRNRTFDGDSARRPSQPAPRPPGGRGTVRHHAAQAHPSRTCGRLHGRPGANMDEERRKEVVEEFRQSTGVRP